MTCYYYNTGLGETQRASSGGYSEQNEVKKQGAMRSEGTSSATMFLSGRSCIYMFFREGVETRPYEV